jgi:hypothetical protein
MADLTDAEIEAILVRVARATPGPWNEAGQCIHSPEGFRTRQGAGLVVTGRVTTVEDCDFIAHAREDVERLAQELRKARRLLALYRRKRRFDGLCGRTWDAREHFEAEAAIRIEEGEPEYRPWRQ